MPKYDTNLNERVEIVDSTTDDKFYNVVMYDDDVTPVQYVQFVMLTVFGHSLEEANDLIDMIQIEGSGVVGTYDREMAYKLCDAVELCNEETGFMLQCEPVLA